MTIKELKTEKVADEKFSIVGESIVCLLERTSSDGVFKEYAVGMRKTGLGELQIGWDLFDKFTSVKAVAEQGFERIVHLSKENQSKK